MRKDWEKLILEFAMKRQAYILFMLVVLSFEGLAAKAGLALPSEDPPATNEAPLLITQNILWQDALMQTNAVRLYDYDVGALGRTSIQGSSSSFRDAQGRLRGKVIRQRNASNFYDAENTYVGRATVSGNTTYFYDKNGNLSGKAVRLGNATIYYDKKGNMIGKATRDSLGNLRFQKSPKTSITSGTGSSGTIQK